MLSMGGERISTPIIRRESDEHAMALDNDGHLHDGEKHFCELQSNGLITCPLCLQTMLDRLSRTVDPRKAETMRNAFSLIDEKGTIGISANELKAMRYVYGIIYLTYL